MKQASQDGHLTQTHNLKICSNCGDYKEFIMPEIKVCGKLQIPSRKVPQICRCEAEEKREKEEKKQKEKEKNRLMSLYKAAEIPPRFLNWTFENINVSKNKQACLDYIKNFKSNLQEGKGLFLIGDKGLGKSTLCYCMMKHLIKNGYTARIVSFKQIIRELQETNSHKAEKSYNQVIKDLMKFDFTVIDDFGRETYTENQLSTAFEVINEMNKNLKCVAITANPEMISYLKSKEFKYYLQFRAILDRLSEMCGQTLYFEGKSFRRQAR